jgi:hypothetical protein
MKRAETEYLEAVKRNILALWYVPDELKAKAKAAVKRRAKNEGD